jgi:hypothetical protein
MSAIAIAPAGLVARMTPDGVALWAFIVAAGLASSIGLLGLGIAPTDSHLPLKLIVAATMLVLAGFLGWASTQATRGAKMASIFSDFLLSILQFLVMLAAFVPLTYLAALPALPLVDATLARLDWLLFGFDWDAAAHWVSARPILNLTLVRAYTSFPAQVLGILFVGSLTKPGDRNAEFLWTMCISLVMTCAVFVLTPALAHDVPVGPYREVLVMIRSGQWTVFDYGKTEGIVTFPSFHTTAAILLTYAARRRRWALAIFWPLNVAMIAATPTVGGHYLVDLIAGAAVALGAIAVTRVVRRWLQRLAPARCGYQRQSLGDGVCGGVPRHSRW